MFCCDHALASDDAELRRLLRENPMPGRLSVTLEREPSFFLAASIEGDRHETVVARAEDGARLLGMASRSVRTAWLNGRPSPLGYLSQLRVDREARDGLTVLGLLEALEGVRDVPLHFTTIFEDNRAMHRALTRDFPGKPSFRALGRFVSVVLPIWRRCRPPAAPGIELRRGAAGVLPAIAACLQRNYARYQLAPVWHAEELADPARSRGLRPEDFLVALRGGAVVGCLSIWDQRGFKQTVVRGYPAGLEPLRGLWNLTGRLTGWPRLPAPGEELPHAYLSHLAVDGEDPEVFHALVARAYNTLVGSGHAGLALGLGEHSALRQRLREAFRVLEQWLVVYLVCPREQAEAAEGLDGRPLHVEVALL
jgi:hypothetical protein